MNNVKASEEFIIGKHGIGYIYSDFLSRVGDAKFELTEKVPTSQKLPRDMNDTAIESELKPGYCTLGDVVAFMDNAPEECKDGYANLFYLPQCVVFVRWFGDGWFVGAWQRGGSAWHAGGRVFSPATGSRSSSTQVSDSLPLELTINGLTYKRV